MSDSDIDGGPEPVAPAVRRRAYRVSLVGRARIFLIISSAIGLWASHFDHFPDLYGTEYEYVVGFALARWELRPSTDPPPNTDYEFMQGIASGLSRSMYNVRGFIQYPVLEVAKLSVQHAVQSHVDYSANAGELDLLLRVLSDFAINLPDGSVYSVRGLLNRWQRVHQPSAVVSVKLAPPFASKVVNSEWSLLHIVSICSRLCRSQLLVPTEPGNKKLSNWLSTLPALVLTTAVRPGRSNTNTIGSQIFHEASLVIDWLDATRYMKDIQKTHDCAKVFSRLFARRSPQSSAELFGTLDYVNAETLRQARVRVDCVAMLVYRLFYKHLAESLEHASCLNVYLFADASPQWRGAELFASTFELFDGVTFIRKLLPVVSLSKTQLDAIGKCLALLWQIFLVVGPLTFWIRHFCKRVRAITTDMGVERLVVDMPDCVSELMQLHDPEFIEPAVEGYLFPRALQMPGWKHQFDLLIKRGLCSLPFFPDWLAKLKAVIGLLRDINDMEVLVKHFKAIGMQGLSEMMKNLSLPNFAHWRWGTLRDCCRELSTVLDSLIMRFDPSLFQGSRDQSQLQKVIAAFSSTLWRNLFDFIIWYTNWIGELLEWGGGCDCHEQELRDGQKVSCERKGRRLATAYEFCILALKRFLCFLRDVDLKVFIHFLNGRAC